MILIENERVVTLAYQMFSVNDEHQDLLLEERTVDDPLEFIFGRGVLLPHVEKAIQGKGFGFQSRIEIHPRDGFGLHNPELQQWMPKDRFPKEMDLQLGMKFQTQGPQGDVISVIVKQLTDDKVLVDGNHPLAGLQLIFDLRVLRVREATDQELAQGEVNPAQLH